MINQSVSRYGSFPEAFNHDSRWVIPQFDEELCTDSFLDAIARGEFTFNEETYQLDNPLQWLVNPSKDEEWHISLHKFYYVVGIARKFSQTGDARWTDLFVEILNSWIEQTPTNFIATDVTGRRVQNWCYAWVIFCSAGAQFDEAFQIRLNHSIRQQVNQVIAHIAPARNHRTLALYAIFLAAITFRKLPQADNWLEFALENMLTNIRSDLLKDGVHCELASDYHQIVLRNYLLFFQLCRLNELVLPADIAPRLVSALEYSMYIHRPDGCIPALSDSDSRSYLYLLAWGARLFDRGDFSYVASQGNSGWAPEQSSQVFPDSGYCVLRSPWESPEPFDQAKYLVFDCGSIGAGNHGHLDGLSIEIAAHGNSLIVDPGRFTYDETGCYNWRAHFRQTRSHNTVTIDGTDQANYVQVGSKRKICPPIPLCQLICAQLEGAIPYLHGRIQCDKYDAIHDRHIWFPNHSYWVIVDCLKAETLHNYEQRFHLTPGESPKLISGPDSKLCVYQSLNMTMVFVATRDEVSVERGYVSAIYGSKKDTDVLKASRDTTDTCFITFVIPRSPNVRTDIESDDLSIWLDPSCEPHRWQWNSEKMALQMCTPVGTRLMEFGI